MEVTAEGSQVSNASNAQNTNESLTPLMQQYKDLKNENPNAILLFRCGDFYETFFEDAVMLSKELQIALTSRGRFNNEPIPLAGVPYHAIDGYIAKLVEKNFTIAVCEQMEDPKKAKGLVKREVVRIITPGTVADPTMLEETSNNYLAAVGCSSERFCLAYADLSTGEVMMTSGDALEAHLLTEEFTRLMPREILVLKESADRFASNAPWQHLNAEIHLFSSSAKEGADALCHIYQGEHRAHFLSLPSLTLQTLGGLSEHLLNTQRCSLRHLSLPSEYALGDGMVLDEATLVNLELLSSGKQNAGGTLFEVLNRTKTGMGARTLKKWLLKPLIHKSPIDRRLKKVETLLNDALSLAEIREVLKEIPDLERILSKISLGSKNPRDLLALGRGLRQVPALKELLKGLGLNELANQFEPLDELTDEIEKTLKDELPPNLADGGVIRPKINPELDRLRALMKDGGSWLLKFEEQEREKTGIKTLKVKKNNVFGYFIEISKSFVYKAPASYIRKQTLVGGERFITAELKDYENRIFTAEDKIVAIEKEIYEALNEKALCFINEIKNNAAVIAEVDVYASLARIASENDYVKPQISEDGPIYITAGRHPVVEKFLSRGDFNPNDIFLDSSHRQSIITGPNMAGKSTFLRQIALIVLMAQIGSYVPAQKAEIGVVDRIFTRVGASDNLVRGQSTFMVEMMEASAILRSATPKSLLILDEIGRGTSTFDGLSLAWSILEYICLKIGARTLFATHYHELTSLDAVHKQIFNLNVGVSRDEKTDTMVFLHKINEGAASESYGIEVAKLAGLPMPVIDRAKEILFELEKSEKADFSRVTRSINSHGKAYATPQQLNLFSVSSALEEELSKIDVNNTTPIEALAILDRLKRISKNGR